MSDRHSRPPTPVGGANSSAARITVSEEIFDALKAGSSVLGAVFHGQRRTPIRDSRRCTIMPMERDSMVWLRIAITLIAVLAAPAAGSAANDLATLQLRAQQGEVEAQRELGVRYFRGDGVAQDDAEAARWLLLAAEQGDADAQNKIGFLRAQGRGVSKDDAKATLWYRRAAELGNAKGQFNFGLACDEGRGVPEDPKQASEWWLRAAAQGHTNSQLKLAVAYSTGRGVRRNPALAFFFAEIVATRLPDAAPAAQRQKVLELRDSLESVLGPRETAKAKQAAEEWQPKSEPQTSLRAGSD